MSLEFFLRDVWHGEQVIPNFRSDVKLMYSWDDHLSECADVTVTVDRREDFDGHTVLYTTLVCGHGVQNEVCFTCDPGVWMLRNDE